MSQKVDKGLDVFTRRKTTAPIEPPQPEVRETKPTEVSDIRPVNHLETKPEVTKPVKEFSKGEEFKFNFYAPVTLFDDLDARLMAMKRKSGWRVSKKDFFMALMQAYVEAHPGDPEVRNYSELLAFFKNVMKVKA